MPLHDCFKNDDCEDIAEEELSDDSTTCAAYDVRNDFSDYTISAIACNIVHSVALYCEYKRRSEVNVSYENDSSDVKLQLDPTTSYHTLQFSQICQDGWFKVGFVCINLFS